MILGYVERSIALFQAMIEFSCYCPEAYAGLSFEKRRDLFEFFWEKEFPRFGQENAPGWLNTIFMGNDFVFILDPNDIDAQNEFVPEYESSGSDSNFMFINL